MKTKLILLLSFALFLISFVIIKQNKSRSQTITAKADEPQVVQEQSVETDSYSMVSPEGSKNLSLEKKASSYSLKIVSNLDGQNAAIFDNLTNFVDLEIPFNSWSPDNVYFFLRDGADYYVFQSSGNLFSENQQYLPVKSLFEKQFPEFVIEDVTGWGGINLIVFNAKNKTSGDKVSFWFEVPSTAFIQLGTYFK